MPSPTVMLAIALGFSLLTNGILTNMYLGQRDDRVRVEQAFDSFKAQAQAQGNKAAREAKAKDAENQKRKEAADAEYTKSLAGLTTELGRLRSDPNRAARGRLPEAPANTRCPAGWACYDRSELERAYGALVKGVRGVADEGAALALRMDTAVRWADGR